MRLCQATSTKLCLLCLFLHNVRSHLLVGIARFWLDPERKKKHFLIEFVIPYQSNLIYFSVRILWTTRAVSSWWVPTYMTILRQVQPNIFTVFLTGIQLKTVWNRRFFKHCTPSRTVFSWVCRKTIAFFFMKHFLNSVFFIMRPTEKGIRVNI